MLLLGLFLAQRQLFLAFNHASLQDVSTREILLCHWRALPMDLSTAGYVLAIVWLLSVPLLFREVRWLHRALFGFMAAFIVLSAIVNVADISLFQAWGVKIDRKALGYLRYPREAAGSISFTQLASLLLVAAVQSLFFIFLLRRSGTNKPFNTGPAWQRALAAALMPGLCLLAMRGGPQDDPINKSWSWFSTKPVLNQAAMNSMWNLLEVAATPAEFSSNPYAYMSTKEAEEIFAEQRPTPGGTPKDILQVRAPNVLLILLESWTADVIEPLGGDSAVAPQFTRLCQDGLLFTNFHSTGFRTEQGLAALISGFPAQPATTVIRNFGKFDHLPSLVRSLGDLHYSSRYYYAGDVEFANTRAYLETMGFQKVYDEHAFPIKRRTRWGAFDEELFDFHLRDAGSSERPFFHVIMTSTSHEPFDAPVDEGFAGGDPQLYRNTIHYTDRCLGAFIDSAKTKDWYANTLIFIVADHGHYLPRYRAQYSAARHRIPFLITGGALKENLRGTVDGTFGSHVDFAPTLLGQLGSPTAGFNWGRDLFSQGTPHSAFWTFNNGFGIADSAQAVVFDANGEQVIEVRDSSRTADEQRLLRVGKAQLQVLLDQYIGFDQ